MKAHRAVILWVLLAWIIDSSLSSWAQVHVRGYRRKDGTYVRPHVRSSPNGTKADNWSTKGNVNPYTGEPGRRSPTYSGGSAFRYSPTQSYSPSPIQQVQPRSTTRPATAQPAMKPPVSSSSGNPSGQQHLEMRYKQSDALLDFQKQAAAKGSMYSQYAMGIRYLKGIGVSQDAEEAKRWLRKAADQGHFKAADKIRELEKRPRLPEK